jgi:glycosyltransferase involved in cell wall biosynthesis
MPLKKSTIVFFSTYPPRGCGIATFTQDLLSYSVKFFGSHIRCKVAALNPTSLDTYKYPKEVEWEIDQNNKKDYLKLAKDVNEDIDVSGVIIQHEYGIFGGSEGNKLLYFMESCKKSMLVTLHTVLPHPNPNMKAVTGKIIDLARIVVVLTQSSKEIIEKTYPKSIGKVFVIPHGIHPTAFANPEKFKEKLEFNNRTVLSTFGLLSSGKGIEYVIKALPDVIKKYPSILYLILGETHPVTRRREGEEYRIGLIKLVKKLHLEKYVKFYDRYLSLNDLFEFLKATDIYISTSTNPNQAVSGTLSYALGAGKPVISTEFAQAKEVVTPDIGRLVAIKDSKSITLALLDLLSDNKRLEEMSRNAYRKTRYMIWSNVADEYIHLLMESEIPVFKLDHLYRMTNEFGIFQFATKTTPNKAFGYTLDDNTRALILCSWILKKSYSKKLEDLINIYFNFVEKCFQKNGSFINYIDFKDKAPSKQNENEDLEDANARALWALSEIMTNEIISKKIKARAKKMFDLFLKKQIKFTHLRAKAFAIKSFALLAEKLPDYKKDLLIYVKEYADSLVSSLNKNTYESWIWFEDKITYSSGLLPESLLIAGAITKNSKYTDKAIISLKFLIGKTFSANIYRPIGQSNWYKYGEKRSNYDQQPEDPAAMILALIRAYKTTQNERYRYLAKKCFKWFLGNNTLILPIYDEKSGGCHDGLRPEGVNENEGAESLISYLMSRYVIKEATIYEN